MNYRVTLVMLGILVVLGVYVYATEFRDKPGAEATPTETADQLQKQIFRFDDNDTKQVIVDRGDIQTIVDRNEDGSWTLEPTGEPADRSRMSSLLFRLSSLDATRRVADQPTNIAQYGLDAPRFVVTIAMKDGNKFYLVIGGNAPNNTGTYVKRADTDVVYLITTQFVGDIEKMITDPPKQPPTPTPAPTATPTPPTEPGADTGAEATPTPGS